MGSPTGGEYRAASNDLFVGRLETMRHNDNGKTRLALLNDQNQVVAFVAPTGRYDMQQYLGEEIGVSAKSLTQSDAGVPFVIVDTVTPTSPNTNARAQRLATWTPDAPSIGTGAKNVQPKAPAVQRASFNSPANSPSQGPIQHSQVSTVGGHVTPACHNGTCGAGGSGVVIPGPVTGEVIVDPITTIGPEWGAVGGCTDCGGGSPCSSCSAGPPPPALPYHGIRCQIPNCQECRARTATICQPKQETCGPPGWLWLRGEYLLWFAKGMSAPPLVTTSPAGTPQSQAGVLGPGTTTLIGGDQDLLEDANSGFRVSFGGFFGPCRKFGYEADFLSLSNEDDEFFANANDFDILARPFFNLNPRLGGDGDPVAPARDDSELVVFPGLLDGSISVNSFSDFTSAGGRARWNFCCKQRCNNCGRGGGCGCQRCGYSPFCKVDFTAGYRNFNLEEGITINENLRAITGTPGEFDITDSFRTENEFNGAELGFQWEAGANRWTFEFLSLVAIGNTEQTVDIDGTTLITPSQGATETFDDGGLLAFDSVNTRDRFTMIPSMNVNLGFYLTPRFRFIVGYSVLYWGGVVRPGEHIPTQLNPDAIAPPLDPTATPDFAFNETDYWIQGLNLGLDYRW